MHEELKNRRILIVDDAPENVEIIGAALEGYKKQVALNGERALKLAAGENKPDLILLDIMMPGMDGFEVCRRLKTDDATKDIPVIFITAKSEVEDETRGLQLGAVDFIPKPISPPVVLARVNNHLELKMARERLLGQNVELASRNKYITDSINYAQRIQNAILQSEDQLNEILPDSMLFFSPKDILSGDFFWFGAVDGRIVFAVVDCTGHGVPGSMMSMVGNTLLNEIVKILKITDPGEILNRLDESVVRELQKEINTTTFDGMDAAVCTYLPSQKKLLFAGAYRPLLLFQNQQMFEVKGFKKSIGDPRKKVEYTSTVLNVESGLEVYLFTDGFTDQNNAEETKFGIGRVKELLPRIREYSMTEQKKIIVKAFTEHKGKEVQRDDVTLLGARLTPEQEFSVLSYSGAIDENKIAALPGQLIRNIEGAVNNSDHETIQIVVRELLYNAYLYSTETVMLEGNVCPCASLEVRMGRKSLTIRVSNRINEENYEPIKSKLTELNSLSENELNALRRVKRLSTREDEKAHAGVGYIDILLVAKSPVEISKYNKNGDTSYIEFTVKIKIGD